MTYSCYESQPEPQEVTTPLRPETVAAWEMSGLLERRPDLKEYVLKHTVQPIEPFTES
jgi:hypothetical protein